MLWTPVEYEKAAIISREVAVGIFERLSLMTIKPQVIVDVGCGIGEVSRELATHYPDAKVLAVDCSEAMIAHAKKQQTTEHYACASGECLPVADETVDLILAHLVLPWMLEAVKIEVMFKEWRRALRPNGLLMMTTLGLDTARVWQEQWPDQFVPHCADMHDLGDALVKLGFADPVLDVDYYTLTYREKNKLFAELVATGMVNPTEEEHDVNVFLHDGVYAVQYEVIHAHAFSKPKNERQSAANEIKIPVSTLLSGRT